MSEKCFKMQKSKHQCLKDVNTKCVLKVFNVNMCFKFRPLKMFEKLFILHFFYSAALKMFFKWYPPKVLPVGSTTVTNVTTHAIVFSQQQTSQHHHQHQRQTPNNDKCHKVFLHKNDKRQNVKMFRVMMLYFVLYMDYIN